MTYFDFENIDSRYWISQGVVSFIALSCAILFYLEMQTINKMEMIKKYGRRMSF